MSHMYMWHMYPYFELKLLKNPKVKARMLGLDTTWMGDHLPCGAPVSPGISSLSHDNYRYTSSEVSD